ncbi:hypothetical protein [Kitasatospora sp. MAP5-34]|uniref:hypothetical protein n=1 Tax=Kitasatospora sp. MAP5-34 TaxID=3035102 RepID=UPI00247313F8|nr:hypothetical protein [Kitasatospora sp. MAP5-34]MDH6580756.1 hypothetical protein [Kitasatospora sp. MAP5-34]
MFGQHSNCPRHPPRLSDGRIYLQNPFWTGSPGAIVDIQGYTTDTSTMALAAAQQNDVHSVLVPDIEILRARQPRVFNRLH